MIDVNEIISSLSKRRPVFHSEADFQLEMGIEMSRGGWPVRLEFPPFPDMALDVWVPEEGLAIELKYPTRGLATRCQCEDFVLKNHSANDIQRYEFLEDIQRLERVVSEYPSAKAGLAMLLTNDPLYWDVGRRRSNTNDAEFRIHEGSVISGTRTWAAKAAPGTTAGRESPIILKGTYEAHWRDYSEVQGQYGTFRCLLVPVG